jgi:DNA-binding IclR family transcriptional regulator
VLLEQLRTRAGDNWAMHKAHIDRALQDFAEHGFVVNCGIQHPDISSAAVPLRLVDGRTTLTLSCSGRASALPRAMLIAEVGPALRSLQQILQGQPSSRRA